MSGETTSDARKAKFLLQMARKSDLSMREMYSLAQKAQNVPGVEPKQIVSAAMEGESSGKQRVTETLFNTALAVGVSVRDDLDERANEVADELGLEEVPDEEWEREKGTGVEDLMETDTDEELVEAMDDFDPMKVEEELEQYTDPLNEMDDDTDA